MRCKAILQQDKVENLTQALCAAGHQSSTIIPWKLLSRCQNETQTHIFPPNEVNFPSLTELQSRTFSDLKKKHMGKLQMFLK